MCIRDSTGTTFRECHRRTTGMSKQVDRLAACQINWQFRNPVPIGSLLRKYSYVTKWCRLQNEAEVSVANSPVFRDIACPFPIANVTETLGGRKRTPGSGRRRAAYVHSTERLQFSIAAKSQQLILIVRKQRKPTICNRYCQSRGTSMPL